MNENENKQGHSVGRPLPWKVAAIGSAITDDAGEELTCITFEIMDAGGELVPTTDAKILTRIVACVNFCAGASDKLLAELKSLEFQIKDEHDGWIRWAVRVQQLQSYLRTAQQSLESKDAELKVLRKAGCEHCGSTRIVKDGCIYCGAPQCCQTCCEVSRLDFRAQKAEYELKAAREEIERLKEPKVEEMIYENGSLTLALQHPFAVRALAESFWDTITKLGGENYAEIELQPKDGPLSNKSIRVIVCRPDGKSPHELRRDAESRAEKAEQRVRELEAQSKANQPKE
jgi:hypothetical protein